MMRLFDKLNTPLAVVLILVAILAVNGFIFFQQRTAPPEPQEPPSRVSSAIPETTEPTTEPETTATSEDTEDTEDAEETNADSEESEEREETTSAPSSDSGDDESGEGDRGEAEEDTSPERTEERTSERTSGRSGEPDDEESQNAEESALAGLGEALERCEGNGERCARDFVSGVSPEARYIGGRTDLASGDSERNSEVLYFEDSGMESCSFEREKYEAESGVGYTVILVGAGSFEDERGGECIPEE